MHGGDIYTNQVELDFSVNLNPLGAPWAVRSALVDACGAVSAYPDPSYRLLREGIAAHYGVPSSRIVVGNGASELIMAVCRAFVGKNAAEGSASGKAAFDKNAVEKGADGKTAAGEAAIEKTTGKALLLAPGFTGYRRALQVMHERILTFPLREDKGWVPDASLEQTIRAEKPQLVLLSNPSNPTGVLLPFSRMAHLAQVCKEVGAVLCVDECFMELTDSFTRDSMIRCCQKLENLQERETTQDIARSQTRTLPKVCRINEQVEGALEAQGTDKFDDIFDDMLGDIPDKREGGKESFPNLVILNAVTKTYAIPGVRLGYAFCSTDTLASRLREQLPEWNIGTMAQAAGLQAMKTDPSYLEEANRLLFKERAFLTHSLASCGFRVTRSRTAFLLFYSPVDLYHPLLRQKILIRDCSDYEGLAAGWYRIAVRSHEDNAVLLRQLQACNETV